MAAHLHAEAPLIRTKLRAPSLPGNFVSRQRITDVIETGSRGAVLLLTAPAGFGKSTAVLDWSLSREPSAAISWLSLDIHDNTPSRFWGHVLAALRKVDESVGSESSEWLSETTDGDPLLFMSNFLNELVEVRPARWLVLDDVHLIENSALLEQLEYVVHHLPCNMGLIMTARFDPGLALHRLRANGDLADVRGDELRMNREEIAIFVRSQVGELSDETISDLESRTDGWPVAVQLLTLRLAQSGDASGYLADSVDDVRPIVDYMVAEILDNLPLRLRTFVLEISVLDGFSEDLCDALLETTDGRSRIQDIVGRGLFIAGSHGDERWYRFHQLFADIVRSELKYRNRDRWIELHRRAAVLLKERGELDRALDHACSGEDWDFVVGNAMDAVLEFANQGDVDRFRRWLTAVPEDYVDRDTTTTTLVGLAHAFSRNFSEAEQHFERAVAADETDDEIRPSLSARAFLALVAGNRDAVTVWQVRARDAVAAIPNDDDAIGARRAEALASAQLAAANCYAGDLEGARAVAERAIVVTREVEFPAPRALAFGALGLTNAFAGRLPSARRALDHLSSIIDGNDLEVLAHGPVRDELAARVAFESDDLDEALDFLARAWGAQRVRPAARPGIAATLSRTFAAKQSEAAAQGWLEQAERALASVGSHPFGQLEVILAELAIAEAGIDLPISTDLDRRISRIASHLSGDVGIVATVAARRAKRILGPNRETPALNLTPVGPRAGVEVHLLAALEATDDAIRRNELVSALDIVQTSGLIRAVRSWGQETATNISQLAADHVAAAVLVAPERKHEQAKTANDRLVEPLSASELRVLAELPSGDSYHEIAGRLFVSQNTVKSHVKAVYRKLDVHSRVAAVEHARELRLLELPGPESA